MNKQEQLLIAAGCLILVAVAFVVAAFYVVEKPAVLAKIIEADVFAPVTEEAKGDKDND